jgi:hypothetical protein
MSVTHSNAPDAEWELDFRVGGREVNAAGSHAFRSRFQFLAGQPAR